jgi:hypothetical protein
MAKLFKGDVGIEFIVNVGASLVEATTYKLVIRKPSGQIVEWQAQVKGEPAEGNLSYTIKEGDLNEAGTYRGHAHVEDATFKLTGESFQFTVFEIFT